MWEKCGEREMFLLFNSMEEEVNENMEKERIDIFLSKERRVY